MRNDTKTRRANVIINGYKYPCWILVQHTIICAFEKDCLTLLLRNNNIDYDNPKSEISHLACDEYFRIRKEQLSTNELNNDNSFIIIPHQVHEYSENKTKDINIYPLDPDKLFNTTIVFEIDGKEINLYDYLNAATEEINKHLNIIINEFSDAISTNDANMRDVFLEALWRRCNDREYKVNPDGIIFDLATKNMIGYQYCGGCCALIPEESFLIDKRMETNRETTWIDAGYGDDDRIGDVTRLNTYKTCGICGKEEKIDTMYIKTENERRRRD